MRMVFQWRGMERYIYQQQQQQLQKHVDRGRKRKKERERERTIVRETYDCISFLTRFRISDAANICGNNN